MAIPPHHSGSGRHRAWKALRMRKAGRQKDREDVEEQEEEEGGGGGKKMASTGEAKPGLGLQGFGGGTLRASRDGEKTHSAPQNASYGGGTEGIDSTAGRSWWAAVGRPRWPGGGGKKVETEAGSARPAEQPPPSLAT